jgi:hypothetical protein
MQEERQTFEGTIRSEEANQTTRKIKKKQIEIKPGCERHTFRKREKKQLEWPHTPVPWLIC